MTTNDNAIYGRPEQTSLDRGDCSKTDEQVSQALETLRLLNNKSNPFSLRQVIARARELKETYTRWEQSGALIKDIVVRLTDGQEIAVDQSKVASLCGLRFRNLFPADAILHVWKQADEQFGEVQLLSLSLQDVQADGYDYAKNYRNGQTLSLRVERHSDGQFYISVDWTVKERAMTATPNTYSWLPLLGPALMVLSKGLSFLRRPQTRYPRRWMLRPSTTFVAGLMLATTCCFLLLRSSTHPALNSHKVENTEPTRVPSNVESGEGSNPKSTTKPESAEVFKQRQNIDTKRKTEVGSVKAPDPEPVLTAASDRSLDKSTGVLKEKDPAVGPSNNARTIFSEIRPLGAGLRIPASYNRQPNIFLKPPPQPLSMTLPRSERQINDSPRSPSWAGLAREGDRKGEHLESRGLSDRLNTRESSGSLDRPDRAWEIRERRVSSKGEDRESRDRSDRVSETRERRISSNRETREPTNP